MSAWGQIRTEYASGYRFRRELLDGDHARDSGRHVIQQLGDGPLEFFYVEREGGYMEPPRLTERVKRWFDEIRAERGAA